ncbi:MAG TPA: hypothetical protein VE954_30400 [Oligoflexus sp.]|uniref:hypothetical protein n=1 Tax=Oligoflexus sp. TaxID=1971216 RepID=UPI002D231A08|nr:hypothetical protein [Oligoflexus sp.]HYX37435.1 hypothetical protein [Oligoflexus sp.]
MKFKLAALSMSVLVGCHSLSNRHDTLAVQCDIGSKTQNKVLLKFTNPGGVALTPAQVAQLQVQYQSAPDMVQTMQPSSQACVALPKSAGLVKARINGKLPLTGEVSLDEKAATDTIHTVELEAPGVLELGLKCPQQGLLAAFDLQNIVEVKKAQGKLSRYVVYINIYNSAKEKVQTLFTKTLHDEILSLPQRFDLKNLAEGTYKVEMSVFDNYHDKSIPTAESHCPLTVRHTCAKDEDFDPSTVSCIPRLCDNTYRVGSKWTESLALKRGEGRYECKQVDEKAKKTLLSHTCQGGYFKSSDSCLAATEIAGNCALLENGDAACWGTQLAKDNYPLRNDINYQTAFRFSEKITKFGKQCVQLESGKIHCWELIMGDNAQYEYLPTSRAPKDWEGVIASGFVNPGQACSELSAFGLDCQFKLTEVNGQKVLAPTPTSAINKCLVDAEGQVWCLSNALPTSQSASASLAAGPYYKVNGLPEPARHTISDGYSYCALLIGGKAMCWGDNDAGGVGSNASDLNVNKLSYVVDAKGRVLDGIRRLTSTQDGNSQATIYALTEDGRAFAWGSNLDGMLANGTPGEDDEGNQLFSRFAVPVMVELNKFAPAPPAQ